MAFRPLPSNFESFLGLTHGPGGTYGDNGYNSGDETPEYEAWGKRVLGAGGTVNAPSSVGFLNGIAYSNQGQNRHLAEQEGDSPSTSYTYTPYADDFFEQEYPFMPAADVAAAKAQSYRDESGNLWIPNNFTQRVFYESPYQHKDSWFEKLMSNGPMIAAAAFLGPAIMGAMGGAGVGAAASADAIGLAQMGQAAGLTGSALSEFVASGGTLGSTAGAVAGSMPQSYWSMLADSSGAGAPSAAARTMDGLGTISSTGNLSLGDIGASSLLGGQAGSVVAGGAGALGLSAETVAAMQALGYSGAEIASMGGNVLNGFTATQALSAGGSAPLSVFDKFLNGILDNPIKSAMSAGQILSGISTANRAMSPQQAQAMADPFSPYRQQYINQLNAVMANPALAMSQPGYQFQRQQGEQALNRKLAVRGMGSYTPDGRGSASGGADIARMKYGQEYALGSYNDYVKQLAGLAGATQAPGVGGQAALSAQAAAAKAATEGWSAINQGIGTADKIMRAAPSGNPNNSGWSTPTTSGAGVGESIMASGYGANLAASNPWFDGQMPRGYVPPGYVMGPLDNPMPIAEAMTQDWYTNPIRGGGYDIGWD